MSEASEFSLDRIDTAPNEFLRPKDFMNLIKYDKEL